MAFVPICSTCYTHSDHSTVERSSHKSRYHQRHGKPCCVQKMPNTNQTLQTHEVDCTFVPSKWCCCTTCNFPVEPAVQTTRELAVQAALQKKIHPSKVLFLSLCLHNSHNPASSHSEPSLSQQPQTVRSFLVCHMYAS